MTYWNIEGRRKLMGEIFACVALGAGLLAHWPKLCRVFVSVNKRTKWRDERREMRPGT